MSGAELAAVDALFEQFWQAWLPPRKARKKALERWRRIRPLPDQQFTDRVIEALQRQQRSAQWLEEGGRYIPYPSNWIAGELWQDETVSLPAPAGGRTVADVDATARLIAEYRNERKAGSRE